MQRVPRFVATAIIAFILYLMLTGSLQLAEVVVGVGIALLSAAIVARFLPFGMGAFSPRRVAKMVAYLPYFLWKVIEANLILAWTVIRPSLPIAPSIVKGRTHLSTPNGRLLLTSSITLTPGTLSVDLDGDDVYVHCVTAREAEIARAEKSIIEPFEERIRGVTE